MQENYNIEDTGKLLTQASRGGRNKKLILITVAAVAVLIVALVAGYFVISDKKYDDQIAIANKAFAEGNYEQAEAAFMKAMDMKKRNPKAREGLAYTYAVEGKFKEASVIYDGLYKETKEEKHKKAYDDTVNEQIPADYDLVPAKGIWRALPENQVGYYTALKWYLFGLEQDYFCWDESAGFDCNDAAGFPALQMIMTGAGNYDISIEDYAAYATNNYDEKYLKDSILEWHDGVDPREWILMDEMYDGYETADAEKADKLMKDIFNISDEDIQRSLADCESWETIYLEDGTYYCVSGWNEGTYDAAIEVKAVWSDGNKYCVQYYGGWDYEENWEEFTVDKTEEYETRYAVIEPKLIDGKHYWSLYSVGEEMPQEVIDGLNAAAQNDGDNKKKSSSADAYKPVIDEYRQMLADVDSGTEYDEFDYENNNGFTYVFSEMIPHELNSYRQPLYAIQDINGDGADEMIVGAEYEGDSFVGSILALDGEGKPVVVIDCTSFMYRGELKIFEDGIIETGGSSGANTARFEFYKLVGDSLDLVDSYVEEDGKCDHNGASMSQDAWFKETNKAREKKHMTLKWNSF